MSNVKYIFRFAVPLSVKKRLRAFMQLDVCIDSMTSTYTALELIQLNIMAHGLLSTSGVSRL